MKKNVFSAGLIFLSILFAANFSDAQITKEGEPGVIVTPTRVEVSGRERSATVTIANSGTVKGSYRIDLINKRMSEDGNIIDVPEGAKDIEFADKMVRLSPRRVTIEPGASQDIRILIRKSKDLPDGEYRTHLSVMVVPEDNEPAPKEDAEKDKLAITVKATYGVTIPIFISNGTVSGSSVMGEIKYHRANIEKKEPPKVTFSITRGGNKSVYGDIKVIYVDNKGTESVLKLMGGLAIYTPNKIRNFEVPLDVPDNLRIGNGTIKVVYQQKEKDGGKIIAQNELKL